MKFNKWTVGLAAAGIVTLPSVVMADAPNMVQTVAANTTLTGYVDVSAQWNVGVQHGQGGFPAYSFGGATKADGFNLNVVDIALDKPLDESPWAAGYHAELWFGPDANALNSASSSSYGYTAQDFAIRQAYVTLRTPVGNGIDWKLGVFDSPLGYESTSSPNNPNFTRSYGYTIEPTELTGLVGSYKICDEASFTAGVVNTLDANINERDRFGTKEDTKAWLAALTLTAPQSWGWLNGSSMSIGYAHGFSQFASGDGNASHLYAGATLATPVTGLKVGAAFDYHHSHEQFGTSGDTFVYGLYASYQATEKLSLHARGEYVSSRDQSISGDLPIKGYELTFTAQYDLWKNVLSRAEVRWDGFNHGRFGSGSGQNNSVIVAANVVYKF